MLLGARGYADIQPGDDEESRAFAVEVIRLNPRWRPGQAPRLPAALGTLTAPRVARMAIGQAAASPRPRERRFRRTRRSSAARGDPDPSEPPDLAPLGQGAA